HGEEGLEILAVNFQENEGPVTSFAGEFGMDFPILLDRDGDVADAYRLFGLPTTFFVDAQGVVRGVFRGPFVGNKSRQGIEKGELERRIEEILP
ncbi:MAG: TlpA family protein disulfide reductase, partial [Dehalococcoidia bacterium]